MPYYTDEFGNSIYKPSIFAKEELPTWDELYHEFYVPWMNGDLQTNKTKDPYWGIEKWRYLTAICCNQLNKMIWEDNKEVKPELVEYPELNMKPVFCVHPDHVLRIGDHVPERLTIYTPCRDKNIFVTSHNPRSEIQCNQLYSALSCYLVKLGSDNRVSLTCKAQEAKTVGYARNRIDSKLIVTDILTDVIAYFNPQ